MGRKMHIFKINLIIPVVLTLILHCNAMADEPNEPVQVSKTEKVTKYIITERQEQVISTDTAKKDKEKKGETHEKSVTFTAYIRADGGFRVERSRPERVLIKKDSQTWRIVPEKNKAVLIPDERKDFPIRLVKGEALTEALGELVISNESAFMQKHCRRKWEKTTDECVHDIYLAVVDGVIIEFTCEKGSREPAQITVTQRFDNIKTYLYECIEDNLEVDDELFEIAESFERIEPKPEPEAAPAEIELKPVSGKKAWALGCAAPLSERNHERHDILAGDEITPWNIQQKKDSLKEWWRVENREDLLKAIENLEAGGHRESFKEIADMLSNLNEEQFRALLDEKPFDSEKMYEIVIVREYSDELGETGILAWDYVRIVNLSRSGYLVGYLTEQEAWDIILPAAEELRQNFNSWEEIGRNYLIGRFFWSLYHTRRTGYLFDEAMIRLMEMPTSPWNMYPWDMEFEEE